MSMLPEALPAALWLVERHPGLFHDDPGPWLARTRRRERLAAWGLDAALACAWGRAALACAPASPLPLARHLVAAVASASVSQRQARFETREGLHDGFFWLTTGARLIRGYTSCEGQNFLLAALLAARLPGVQLFETRSLGPPGWTHTLARFRRGSSWIFADAWADEPLFSLDEGVAGAPSYASLAARGLGPRQGLYPRAEIEAGTGRSFARMLPSRMVRDPGSPSAAGADVPRSAWWRAYLQARAHHLFGAPLDALARYEALAPGAPAPWLGEVVRAFAGRIISSRRRP